MLIVTIAHIIIIDVFIFHSKVKLMYSKVYTDVCKINGPDYYDYENFKISWGTTQPYDVIQKLGRGRYSEVYDSINTSNNKRCVIKILKPVIKTKIRREIKILQTLFGGPNIIKLYDVIKDPVTKVPALVFEYIENQEYKKLFPIITLEEIKQSVRCILTGLDYCHSMGIMHRDIKPQNILFGNTEKRAVIIDWGLAEYYIQDKDYNIRVASRYYKGPELLVDDSKYSYSLDLWSTGCVLASMMFKKEPMFKGKCNHDQLYRIIDILGTEKLMDYVKKYKLKIDAQFSTLKSTPEVGWETLINEENKHLVTEDGIDLLRKMLLYDRDERITAKNALAHPFLKV